MSKAIVAIGALGGTISMTKSEGEEGITSKIGAEELIKQIPELAQFAEIRAATIYRQSSCSLTFAQLFATLAWAKQQIADGAQGVVLSQGTDTIEQTAFFFDLYWDLPEPLVVIGAMRGPQAVSFDGLANLLDAVIVASDSNARERGVLVCLNDTVHEARWVRKSNTVALDTFESPIHGPVGIVCEGKVEFLRASRHPAAFPVPETFTQNVFILEHGLADDPAVVDFMVQHGTAGIVVSAVGSGHVAEPLRDALVKAVKAVPIIICSRTGSGATTVTTYGYTGSEIDLQKHGCFMGGWLNSIKARMLLLAAVWNGYSRAALVEKLDDWKKGY